MSMMRIRIGFVCVAFFLLLTRVEAVSSTPVGFRIDADPHYTPTPTPTPVVARLEIDPFVDFSGSVGSIFTISGIADPFAEITLWIAPDGIGSTTTADKNGMWRHILTSSLTSGEKTLHVTARNDKGGQLEKDEVFTVRTRSLSAVSFLFILVLAAIGGVMGYNKYKKQRNISDIETQKQSPLRHPRKRGKTQ